METNSLYFGDNLKVLSERNADGTFRFPSELVPEDDGLGSCGAMFSTLDDPDLVIEHSRSRLEAAGWAIDPPLPPPPAPPEDGIEMQSVWLGARKETMGYGVSAEILGGPETVFVIHVGESG